jgi:hypothetical protein
MFVVGGMTVFPYFYVRQPWKASQGWRKASGCGCCSPPFRLREGCRVGVHHTTGYESKGNRDCPSLKINFKAGHGWCNRFMPHEGLSVRHRISINLSVDSVWYSRETANFRLYVQLMKKQNYASKHVGNADEPRRCILVCLEITLWLVTVQKKLKL